MSLNLDRTKIMLVSDVLRRVKMDFPALVNDGFYSQLVPSQHVLVQ